MDRAHLRQGRWQRPIRVTVNAVITAVGQLREPKLPDIQGVGSFKGPAFHSARWDHGVDLKGKRVAVIGTGASAFQFVPAIAPDVKHLTVFQRTPPWLGPTPNYHDDVEEGQKWLLKHVPIYAQWYRFWIFWMMTDGILPMVKRDPNWTSRQDSGQRRKRHAARDADAIHAGAGRRPSGSRQCRRAQLSHGRQAQRARQWRVAVDAQARQCRTCHRSHRRNHADRPQRRNPAARSRSMC